MSCCGGRRRGAGTGREPRRGLAPGAGVAGPGTGTPQPEEGRSTVRREEWDGARVASASPLPGVVLVRYEGRTGMTARGGATGHRYRFDEPGAVLQVDPRDLPSLLAVPGLRRMG